MKDNPFKIVILGDFSGRKNKLTSSGQGEPRAPELIPFDRYDFLRLFKLLAPELILPSFIDPSEIHLRFEEMDDFHPDKLATRIPFFNRLLKVNERLEEGDEFESAFKELLSVAALFDMPVAAQDNFADSSAKAEENALVSGLLKGEDSDFDEKSEDYAFTEFISQSLKPHLVNEITPRQEEIISAFKKFVESWLRALIHHPDFKSLESAWRSLHFLAVNLDAAPNLKLHLIDISKKELLDDFADSEQIEESVVYKLLLEKELANPDAEPWTLLVGDYFFSDRTESVQLLKYMGEIAKLARAPFIAGADSIIAGAESSSLKRDYKVPEEWQNFRLSSEANYIGIITPRFLLRLPYGKDTYYCDAIEFEELSSVDSHEEYLWGNPAFLAAYLLGDAFLKIGWELGGELTRNIEGLPLHARRCKGEAKLKPCAEVILGVKELLIIERLGLIPLYSIPDSDAARLGELRSLALPASRLRGSWS